MDNKFHNFEKNISLSEIKEAEENIEYFFPKKFKEFYLSHNGGTPEKCCWTDKDSELDYLEIASFIPFKFCEKQHNNPDHLIDGIYKKMVIKKIIPANIVPFATDWGGNFFCIRKTDNSIIYYTINDILLQRKYRRIV